MVKRLLLTILLCLVAATSWARNEQSSGMAAGVAGFDTNIVWQIHDNANFRTTVTNYGYFGTVRGRLRDSAGVVVPMMQSPPNSGIEYLYEGGLWIGGIVGSDTLVSTGTLGFGEAHELYADAPDPALSSDLLGDEEATFVYSDTTTDPETVREDTYDGPHRPLPVSVRQKTYVLDAGVGNAGLFIELTVTNLGSVPIDSLWLGWMMDPDVGHADVDDYWNDDITGYWVRRVPSESGGYDLKFAWAMDNDGDPDKIKGFTNSSPRRALASMFLGSDPPMPGESYNWWIPSTRNEWDWGPQLAPGDVNAIGGRGYTFTDAYRYRRMANREIDYPSPYAAVDSTSGGWIAPTTDSIARDFADGFDTRFLHTAGPATLAPGDSLIVHWVLALTRNAHVNPEWFNLTFNPADPGLYVSGLQLNLLGFFMTDLKVLWEDGFATQPIRPPQDFRLATWDHVSGTLAWTPRGTHRLGGYQIRQVLSDSESITIGLPLSAGESTFVATGLNREATYYYSIACVNERGVIGPYSNIDSLLPDRPRTPQPPTARGGKQRISVRWPSNDEPDLRGYHVYRRAPGADWELLSEALSDTGYVDSVLETAVPYDYRVTALSTLESESYPSTAATAVAFAFNGPPQLLDYTTLAPMSLTDKDSVHEAWLDLFPGVLYRDESPLETSQTFADFSPHPVSVIVADGRESLPSSESSLWNLYSASGGVTIISGRDLFNHGLSPDSLVTLQPGSIGTIAGIRRAYYPRTLTSHPTRMNAEFVAAQPTDPALPRLDVDSTRTGWGLNPVLVHPGPAIPFVGYFEVDTALAEVLYTFLSKDRATSALHGKPVAVMSKEPGRTLAVFAFPLSYIEEDDARACLAAVLARLGYGSSLAAGDADNDGVVTAADVVSVINYLYRDGYLINERNADVNGDCRVDVLDVVYLMDHIYHGQGVPQVKCP